MNYEEAHRCITVSLMAQQLQLHPEEEWDRIIEDVRQRARERRIEREATAALADRKETADG